MTDGAVDSSIARAARVNIRRSRYGQRSTPERACYHGSTNPPNKERLLDSDYRIDVSEVIRNIDGAEVIALYFPLLRRTLLMDLRTNEIDGAMIRVVPMANTPEERFQSLVKMRPRFRKPDSIVIIPWPKYVASIADLGIWDHIVRRYADTGSPSTVRECERCLRELTKMERDEIHRAISGENYETMWGKRGVSEVEALVSDDEDDFDEDDDESDTLFEEDDA